MSEVPNDLRPKGLAGVDLPTFDVPLWTREAQYHAYMGLLALVSETAPGMTVNQLRCWEYIEMCHDTGELPGVTRVAAALNLSKGYVSDVVVKGIEGGWLVDVPHPDDRRKRVIKLSDEAYGRREQFWKDWRLTYLKAAEANVQVLQEMGVLTPADVNKVKKRISAYKNS